MSAEDTKVDDDDLVDYDEDEGTLADSTEVKTAKKAAVSKGYSGIHASGFRDFLLKSELLLSINDCGFEHPSEVQQETIPQAVTGMDIICQAKSGMGKTAVFVLATLQQLVPVQGQVDTLVLCHTRELAYQICQEFLRFSKYLPEVKIKVFFGGIGYSEHKALLAQETPHIVVGTPGRIKQLAEDKCLKLDHLKRFILDECDQMLESLNMRRDVQSIFKMTPHEKQVMMFSATLTEQIRPVCKKFTNSPVEIYVDEAKLTLHGLQQYYVQLSESQKNKKLIDLLDALDFNQVVIFVNRPNSGKASGGGSSATSRCRQLDKLLVECNFPSTCIYGALGQEDRLERYNKFKEYKSRILVSTDIFGRGVDFERVNIVINYDMPAGSEDYLHRVGRSGRFGTKGLAVTFISSEEDTRILNDVQSRFEVEIASLPDEIDVSSYMTAT